MRGILQRTDILGRQEDSMESGFDVGERSLVPLALRRVPATRLDIAAAAAGRLPSAERGEAWWELVDLAGDPRTPATALAVLCDHPGGLVCDVELWRTAVADPSPDDVCRRLVAEMVSVVERSSMRTVRARTADAVAMSALEQAGFVRVDAVPNPRAAGQPSVVTVSYMLDL
jgi:hypothetical protein